MKNCPYPAQEDIHVVMKTISVSITTRRIKLVFLEVWAEAEYLTLKKTMEEPEYPDQRAEDAEYLTRGKRTAHSSCTLVIDVIRANDG
jgi:hypothetical protein